MRLAHPLLLLTAVPVALLALWAYRARGLSIAGGRPWAAALRLASLALLVAALAQPQISQGHHRSTVLVLDRSLSVSAGGEATERAWLRAERQECRSRCRVVQFAGAGAVTGDSHGLLAARAGGPLEGDETGMARALSLALARSAPGGRIVLLSDGLQTQGETAAVMAAARARHVSVQVVPLRDDRVDAAITHLSAPRALHAGDPLSLELNVRATVPRAATISLYRDGRPAGHHRLALTVGDNPYAFEQTAPGPGDHTYEARVSMAGDELAGNDRLATTVRVSSPPRVLVVGPETQAAAAPLRADGMQVSIAPAGALPESPGGYGEYDAVVLADVSAGELGDARARALTEAVHSGRTGLLTLGGPQSFSLGHYYHSPLQKALPVSSLIPGRLQRRNVAIELVLDHSGSMLEEVGGYAKIEMAQTAAKVTARFLAKHRDELGIVAFEIKPETLVPLQRVAEGADLKSVERRIGRLLAEGGTNIYLGLDAGIKEILKSHAPQRHVILMTDGESEPGAYKKYLPVLHRNHITVSTVALGLEAQKKLLREIARETNGRFYYTNNAHDLPRIFSKETRVSARPVRTHGTIPVIAGSSSPVLRSVSGESLPSLHGNVVTTLKSGAQADLLGKDQGHPPDPVLAQWSYGVGRVVTWTPGLQSDLAGEWAGRSELWQDAVRWLERGVRVPELTPRLVEGSDNTLEVDTIANADARLDSNEMTGTISGPGGTRTLSFSEVAPSRFVARVSRPLAQGGYTYRVAAAGMKAEGKLAVPYPIELRPGPEASTPLGPIASATGGHVLGAADHSALAGSWQALWRWLALAALLCFLAGLALRMLAPAAPRRRGRGGGRNGTGPNGSGNGSGTGGPAGVSLRARPARTGAPSRTGDREAARS